MQGPDDSLPPKPPATLQTLKWLQLNWRRHWKLLAVFGLILAAPYLWQELRPEIPESVSAAIAGLDDPSPDVQLEAVASLQGLEHPRALRALHDALLEHPSQDVRCRAATALGDLGRPESVEVLWDYLGSDRERGCHFRALWALGTFACSDAACERIRGYVTDEDGYVRAAAVRALATAGREADIPLFVEALEDSVMEVRGEAAEALVSHGQAAMPALLARAEEPGSVDVRFALASILGRIGDDRAVPFLASQLSVRETGRLGRYTVYPFGVQGGGGGQWVGGQAKSALERIGTPAALAALDTVSGGGGSLRP